MRAGGEGPMNAIERRVSGDHRPPEQLTQFEDYTEYKCLYCNERCINELRSISARANLCRKCLQNPAACIHGRLPPEEYDD